MLFKLETCFSSWYLHMQNVTYIMKFYIKDITADASNVFLTCLYLPYFSLSSKHNWQEKEADAYRNMHLHGNKELDAYRNRHFHSNVHVSLKISYISLDRFNLILAPLSCSFFNNAYSSWDFAEWFMVCASKMEKQLMFHVMSRHHVLSKKNILEEQNLWRYFFPMLQVNYCLLAWFIRQ